MALGFCNLPYIINEDFAGVGYLVIHFLPCFRLKQKLQPIAEGLDFQFCQKGSIHRYLEKSFSILGGELHSGGVIRGWRWMFLGFVGLLDAGGSFGRLLDAGGFFGRCPIRLKLSDPDPG